MERRTRSRASGGHPRGHRLWRLRGGGLVALFLLSLPAVTTRLYASDEIQYFAYLRSLWFDHDLSFENEYRYFYDRGIARAYGFHRTFLELETPAGRRYNFGTIGCAILWAPFYAAGDLAARTARGAGGAAAADGFSWPYLAAIAYGSAVYGFLAVVLSILVAERVIGRSNATSPVGLAVWTGTPLLFYMYLAPGMAHACSAFVVAAFVWTWLSVREQWSIAGTAALGALAALMGMVREQDLFYALGPAVDFILTSRRGGHSDAQAHRVRLVGSALVGVGAFALAFLPQGLAYLVLNGRLGPPEVIQSKMNWVAPYALAVLVSPHHGLFVWTPLAALGVFGLVWLVARRVADEAVVRHRRQIAWGLLLMFAAQVYISGSVGTWTVAGAFGQRRFVGATVLIVVGLAALVEAARTRRARVLLWSLVGLSMWWNLSLMAQFGAGLMDRQRLEPLRNAYTSFIVIPRLAPELAYRYLFDRASFYRPPPTP